MPETIRRKIEWLQQCTMLQPIEGEFHNMLPQVF
jgi:hypothetical protein